MTEDAEIRRTQKLPVLHTYNTSIVFHLLTPILVVMPASQFTYTDSIYYFCLVIVAAIVNIDFSTGIEGKHGWNNTWEKMHAVFIAKGPSFKHSYTRDTFENVNLYPLMCSILGITDHPPVNGSIANIHDVLLKGGIPKTFIICKYRGIRLAKVVTSP